MSVKSERKKPSACRNSRPSTSRIATAVSIAKSENRRGAPGRCDGSGRHAFTASGESQSVTSPRWTSARSYAGQFPTQYLVLYFGWTRYFIHRVWSRSERPVRPRRKKPSRRAWSSSAPTPRGSEKPAAVRDGRLGCLRNRRSSLVRLTPGGFGTWAISTTSSASGHSRRRALSRSAVHEQQFHPVVLP